MSELKKSVCEYISDNIKRIRYNINEAEAKSGRKENSVRLMAVTKTVDADRVNFCVEQCGINLLGENRVQEFLSKEADYAPAEIHFIGALQSNKVKYIAGKMSVIETASSEKLLREISRLSPAQDTGVLIEVNIGNEESKSGIRAGSVAELNEKLAELAEIAAELPNIELRGLMTIPPFGSEPDRYFAGMEQLFRDNERFFGKEPVLSMGMSGDYETAVRYGANLVRVGTAIFGGR
ncbi:YggS family pyridoxal phosphate enzyme [Clostridia bacterium]|nr:YggS family pyridoxal phosphate enzyme [Clostridia bacterium]